MFEQLQKSALRHDQKVLIMKNEVIGQSMAANTTEEAWNTTAVYPSCEHKFDTMEFQFNPKV